MFVGALEAALIEGTIDLAVHSAKDMPIVARKGLVIAAYPERADPRDALVTAGGGATLSSLPEGARVGTDSPRRAAFLGEARRDLRIGPMHGNVDTRLGKLDRGEVDALVLAAAGLERLGLAARIDYRLSATQVPPAPAQGVLAIQVRSADLGLVAAIGEIDEPDVRLATETERRVLAELGGSCRTPVGALAEVVGGRLRLVAGAVGASGSHLMLLEDSADELGSTRSAAAAGAQLRAHLAGTGTDVVSRRAR